MVAYGAGIAPVGDRTTGSGVPAWRCDPGLAAGPGVVHSAVRRWRCLDQRSSAPGGGGWPAIVVFAAAYGVVEEGLATQSLFNPEYAHQHLLSSGFIPALGIAIPWTVHVLSLHVIWSICTPIALVECMFPDRNTTPWLRTPGPIVIAGLYVLGVVATFAVTWAEYRYVASAGRLIGAAIIAVILIIAGMLLTKLRRSSQAGIQASRPAPRAWIVGIFAAVAASILVVAPWIPNAIESTLTFLVIEAAAVITVTRWSSRPRLG